jgi:hypothetical protein
MILGLLCVTFLQMLTSKTHFSVARLNILSMVPETLLTIQPCVLVVLIDMQTYRHVTLVASLAITERVSKDTQLFIHLFHLLMPLVMRHMSFNSRMAYSYVWCAELHYSVFLHWFWRASDKHFNAALRVAAYVTGYGPFPVGALLFCLMPDSHTFIYIVTSRYWLIFTLV